jgi:putative protease
LAPAGNPKAFLAALAADADAIYCGLKQFSARMMAKNFTIEALGPLVDLAHARSTQVYIALNSLLKPEDLSPTLSIIEQLERQVRPDALIVQDLAMVNLARQAGFSGEIHLSTLANASFPAALSLLPRSFGIRRVVIPRELDVDEIKQMAAACPPDLELEVFIHGALCYAVSGRCYWSSFLGGKSGLRGRCVQPCRRVFSQAGKRERFFACRDLSLDVLVKVLKPIEQIKTWKIEGRKKSPHYVYYTVTAYRMLRDEGGDAGIRRSAVQLLERALGRPGTHYHFLPQRLRNPIDLDSRTGSGLMIGSIKGPNRHPYIQLREALFPNDYLRIGYEDQPWHRRVRVNRSVPKGGQFNLKPTSGKSPPRGTPVFLTDRQEPALGKMMAELEKKIDRPLSVASRPSIQLLALPRMPEKPGKPVEMHVLRDPEKKELSRHTGIWILPDMISRLPRRHIPDLWFWMPPVIWPQNEKAIGQRVQRIIDRGGRKFVLNAPWQTVFYSSAHSFPMPGLVLWAGPFCNLANSLAIEALADLGFSGAVVSPELDKAACLALPGQSPLPLGIVVSGHWPLGLSRIVSDGLKLDRVFTSPKREAAWVTRRDDTYWLYPNWRIDLSAHKNALVKAGYTRLIHMADSRPAGIQMKDRPGLWNWSTGLK